MARDDKKGAGSSGGFDRDFGYLMPFLDRISEAAGSMGGAEGAELKQLVDGEKARWGRIRELLSGAPAETRPGTGPRREEGPGARPGAAPQPAARASELSRQGRGLTVGSIKRLS